MLLTALRRRERRFESCRGHHRDGTKITAFAQVRASQRALVRASLRLPGYAGRVEAVARHVDYDPTSLCDLRRVSPRRAACISSGRGSRRVPPIAVPLRRVCRCGMRCRRSGGPRQLMFKEQVGELMRSIAGEPSRGAQPSGQPDPGQVRPRSRRPYVQFVLRPAASARRSPAGGCSTCNLTRSWPRSSRATHGVASRAHSDRWSAVKTAV
jgi:hypothetical protein